MSTHPTGHTNEKSSSHEPLSAMIATRSFRLSGDVTMLLTTERKVHITQGRVRLAIRYWTAHKRNDSRAVLA